MPPWPVSASRVPYENQWIRVVEDDVTRPDGATGIYGVVEVRNPAVFVVALTAADEVVLITVDRHTVGPSIEVPAGGTDGQHPLVAAERELREEAGLMAERWHEIGRMWSLNGVCRAPGIVYLATDLTPSDEADTRLEQEAEGISSVQTVPLTRVVDLVRQGQITDNESLGALMYALAHLGRVR